MLLLIGLMSMLTSCSSKVDYQQLALSCRAEDQDRKDYIVVAVTFDPDFRTRSRFPLRCPGMLVSFSDKVGLSIQKEGLERSSRRGKRITIVLKGKGVMRENKEWKSPEFQFTKIIEQGEWIVI